MKAAVCYEFGKPLVVEEVDIDSPQEGEVIVRTAAVAICHSDIHEVRGEWGGNPPIVSGHEASGVVEEVGESVTLVKTGDAVVVSALRSCGRCFCCTTGSPGRCDGEFPLLDKQVRLRNKRGVPLQRGQRVAGFAECVLVDQSQAVPVPADMPLDRAALLACAVITGVGTVVNTARVEFGSSVVVIGTGGIGLNAIQGAALVAAYPIIAVDILDNKLTAARTFGATHTINGKREDPIKVVQELTSGRGVDYVFVAVGSTTAIAQGFDMLCTQGTLVIVGVPRIGATVSLPVLPFPKYERRVIGSGMGSTRLSVDIPRLVALYQQGRLKLDELITARYPLERINEAIETVERGKALRNVIVF